MVKTLNAYISEYINDDIYIKTSTLQFAPGTFHEFIND